MPGGARPGPVRRTLIAVVGAAIAHPGDRVVGGPVGPVGAVRFERLEAVEPAVPLGPLVGGSAITRRRRLRGSRADDATGPTTRLGRWHRRVGRPAGGTGSTGTLGDRLDDLGLRRAGVPRPRRLGALAAVHCGFGAVAGSRLARPCWPGRSNAACCDAARAPRRLASSCGARAPGAPAILDVTAANRPSALRSLPSGAARRLDMPRYQRSIPINSTTAEVKNINGKRSING